MKKNCLFLVPLLVLFFVASAQQIAPSIQWQKSLGGSQNDYAGRIVRSTDGGYVVASITTSQDGDVITHTGNSNIWLVKFSNTGSIVWQKCFANGAPLPGTSPGNPLDLKNTADGGYIIASATSLNNASFSGYHAGSDALIIKVSSDGTPQWQRCYGSSQLDVASAIQPTSDGGYIFFGETAASSLNSPDGDVSGGDGGRDIWVVKIDKTGNIQWQKCLWRTGYSFSSPFSYPGGAIKQTNDNGFILTGTYPVYNINNGTYNPQVWVVKLDNAGTLLWQKYFGGAGADQAIDIIQATDGNYLTLATTNSSDGDVTSNHRAGSADTWVIKLNDQGSIIWQKCYGGVGGETASRIKSTPDGNFLIAGSSNSDDGDVAGVHFSSSCIGCASDAWVFKIDNAGTMLWQKAFGGTKPDVMNDFCLTDDGEIAFVADIQSGSDGDVIGSHNSFNVQSYLLDVWVVKTGGSNTIKGSVFIDYNANGIKDGNDAWIKKALVKSEKPGYSWQTFLSNGIFSNKVDTGTFVTSIVLDKPYYKIVPVTKQSSFNTFFNTDSIGFSLLPIAGKRDYSINLLPLTPARPGFYSTYKIKFDNAGTDTLLNKTVQLIKDRRTSFQYASPAPASISGDTLKWNIANLLPSDSGSIVLTFLNSSPALHIGDTLRFVAAIDTAGDLATSDNVSLLRQRITGAYDPNDKQENFGGTITPADIAANKRLTYTIRFQNTGNDTAFNIIVRDTLDAKTALNSIQMIDASHSYQLNIKDGKYCTWQFSNIKLVDSVHNEPASHGYLTYSIKPASTFVLGDTIRNNASIYFDFNPPVKTNNNLTVLRKIDPPPKPVVTGLQNVYCNTTGIQKGKITNLPSLNSDIAVTVKLNTSLLQVAADSTFIFDASSMATGAYNLAVLFSNSTGADTLLYNIVIRPLITPDVNLSANISTVVNLTDPVIITATNASGGGTSPKYTFAKDKAISNILQAEGTGNTLTIQPNTLTVGSNWIYARMKTSDTCFTVQANIDSININRSTITGIRDVDFPNQLINVFPNPFSQVINISGLNTGKTYVIDISNSIGQKVYSQQLTNASNVAITKAGLQNGTYRLSIYDAKKKKLVGTVSVIKE